MIISNTARVIKYLLVFPVLLVTFYCYYIVQTKRLEHKRLAISSHIGRQFPQLPLVDSNAKSVSLPLATPIVIVEFWFRNCPYCRAEMQQFERLLKGNETKYSIISIAIDDSIVWKKVISGNDEKFKFLSPSLPNWNHYLLTFKNEAQENINTAELAKRLHITSYPAFFVLDKKGLIKATPASAIAYIGNEMGDSSPFLQFLLARTTWHSVFTYIVMMIALGSYRLMLARLKKKAVA